MIAVTGGAAAGVVWGWLAGRPVALSAFSGMVVCAAAVEALMLAGPAAAVAVVIGGAVGVGGRSLVRRHLARGRKLGPG